MNYSSVEEIISAGTTNMTALRENSRQDEGTDTITGVSWFSFNGITASTIYANGNSWIGFGSSNEHIKVNRRDAAMWYLYTEEGTLYNYYKFFKIKWKGYSLWNASSSSYMLEYDVILWDTGDISLHMVAIPEMHNNGIYSLTESSTYTYTVSTTSPNVTFKKTDSGFEVQNNIIALEKPSIRYLVKDGDNIYSVSNNALVLLDSSELSSTLFLNSGVETLPNWSIISTLTNPEILYWSNFVVSADQNLIMTAVAPLPQTILYSETIPGGSSIDCFELVATDDILFNVTFDNGTTWKYWNGQEWMNSDSTSDGMSGLTLSQLTSSNWENIVTSNDYQIRCILPTTTSSIKDFFVIYT